jgi:hypothetical protein
LCIKDLKDGCFADRLSCHRFSRQPVPAPPACGRLLVARYGPALAGSAPGPASPARHPPPAAHQDRGLGAATDRDGLPSPRQQSPRRAALAPPCHSPRSLMNRKG